MSGYTEERNTQILIQILKANNIRKVIASPGTTNACFVTSLQSDPFFEIYSAPDERSAAYIACGLSVESNEPVVISCTGATASRNYYPGLTEAFYRKIPVLAVTSSRSNYQIGHNIEQVTDRTVLANDVARISVQIPFVIDEQSERGVENLINKAVLELFRNGGGPVHINLETRYSSNYLETEPKKTKIIQRISYHSEFPEIKSDHIAVVVGNHEKFTPELVSQIEKFCKTYNGVVYCDATSNYHGKFRVDIALLSEQPDSALIKEVPLLIDLGNVNASDYAISPLEVWRVSEDGEIRDRFGKLTKVFEMQEIDFFKSLNAVDVQTDGKCSFLQKLNQIDSVLSNQLTEVADDLPVSATWLALESKNRFPDNSILHLGILNSLRNWNYFPPSNINCFANTGGFGIDGCLSSAIGASLFNQNQIVFCILGDLALFYDLNVLGNRHLGRNIRILVINNGIGSEFKLNRNICYALGSKANEFQAAAGHYGNKSRMLLKDFCRSLGFEYYAVETKDDFHSIKDRFFSKELTEKPLFVEVFTNHEDENLAINTVTNLLSETKKKPYKSRVINLTKKLLGNETVETIRSKLKG